jgi:glutaminyl-tRNA synthetase
MQVLNPNANEVVKAYLEPGMKHALPDNRYQFERHEYFVANRVDSVAGKPVFNRVVTLKDSWGGVKKSLKKIEVCPYNSKITRMQ